jgi:hypothetical protein
MVGLEAIHKNQELAALIIPSQRRGVVSDVRLGLETGSIWSGGPSVPAHESGVSCWISPRRSMLAQRSTIWWSRTRQNTIPVNEKGRLLTGTGIMGRGPRWVPVHLARTATRSPFRHYVFNNDSQVGKSRVQHGPEFEGPLGADRHAGRDLMVPKIRRQLPPDGFGVLLVDERFVMV